MASSNNSCQPFPENATKGSTLAWIINKLTWENRQKDKELSWWRRAFMGQLVFWVSLFVYGKVYAGWFPV